MNSYTNAMVTYMIYDRYSTYSNPSNAALTRLVLTVSGAMRGAIVYKIDPPL